MRYTLPDLSRLSDVPFDTVIDVRAPAEFAEDHIPGAINLPVLSDAERARVGTIYTLESPFKARKLGAALVSRNAATHLETTLADKPGSWQPLVYCWRGGQRSGSFASILEQIGWRVQVLEGGYQTYRRAVVAALYDTALAHRLILLDGDTGTAKTDLLHLCAQRGVQMIDLEGLANHRGSVLGPRPGGQPSQKAFETALMGKLAACDPARPILVEAESSKVGNLLVPPSFWAAMLAAPRITVAATLGDRATYLAQAYADLSADPDRLEQKLAGLVNHVGHDKIAQWSTMIADKAFRDLARDLIEHHYDARYAKSRQEAAVGAARIEIALDPQGLQSAAERITQAVCDLS
jgi:tRNA 2-selenouridine synthase